MNRILDPTVGYVRRRIRGIRTTDVRQLIACEARKLRVDKHELGT
jgi:hypothetical protein